MCLSRRQWLAVAAAAAGAPAAAAAARVRSRASPVAVRARQSHLQAKGIWIRITGTLESLQC